MDETILEKEIDVSGVEITPGKPSECLGNGDFGFECCCDECDYMICCFVSYDPNKCKICKDKNCPRVGLGEETI